MELGDTVKAPDVVGEAVGFRGWYVHMFRRGPLLVSPTQGTAWPGDDWMRATHVDGYDEPIHDAQDDEQFARCRCGIYAARSRRHLLGQDDHPGGSRYYDHPDIPAVIGEVALAGLVAEAPRGWRAQRARVVRLWLPYEHWTLDSPRVGIPLSERYRVPVILDNTLRA